MKFYVVNSDYVRKNDAHTLGIVRNILQAIADGYELVSAVGDGKGSVQYILELKV